MNFQEKTADLLYNAVKKSTMSLSKVSTGDLIVITGTKDDKIGIVASINLINNKADICLRTSAGIETIQVNDTRFIHTIRKATMLDLRDHSKYQRDDDEVDVIKKNKDKYKERPEYSVEKSDKSVLPTSKISLSLRKDKKS